MLNPDELLAKFFPMFEVALKEEKEEIGNDSEIRARHEKLQKKRSDRKVFKSKEYIDEDDSC